MRKICPFSFCTFCSFQRGGSSGTEIPSPGSFRAKIRPNIRPRSSTAFLGRPGRSGRSGSSEVSTETSGPHRKICPQQFDLIGTYLRGHLPQWFPSFGASLTPPLLTSKTLIPLNPSNDSCPYLGKQERRFRSTTPPITFMRGTLWI